MSTESDATADAALDDAAKPRRRARPGVLVAATIAIAALVALLVGVDRDGPPDRSAAFVEQLDEIGTQLATAEADVAEDPDRAFHRLDAALGRAVDGYAELEPPALLRDDMALLLDALRAERDATAALAADDAASTADLLERRSAARNLQSAVRRSAAALADAG